MREFYLLAGVFILLTVAVGLTRVLLGPRGADRMMAAQLLGSGGIAAMLLTAAGLESAAALDVALTFALLAAVAAVAFTKSGGRAARTEED